MTYSWKDKGRAYLCYTIGFILVSMCLISIFNFYNISFVYSGDAFTQSIPTRAFLNDLIKNILSGIPVFNFNIAGGHDVLATHHYYGLTDIVSIIISIVTNISGIDLYSSYILEIFLRMYFAGISFILLCLYFRKKIVPTILGSFIYVFSNYILCGGIMHPFFIGNMIWFPLLIVGINKIIKENKVVFFILVSFFSILSNIYFFFVMSIFLLVYGIITIAGYYKENGLATSLKIFMRGIASYTISVLLSSFILVPTLYFIYNSIRGEKFSGVIDNIVSLNFLGSYILDIFSFPTLTNYIAVSLSIFVLATLVSFVLYNKEYRLKTLLVMVLLLAISPKLQYIASGFLYPNYRWYFVLTLILSYIFVDQYYRLLDIRLWIKLVISAIVGIYILLYAKEKINFSVVFSKGIIDGLLSPSFYIPMIMVVVGVLLILLIMLNDFKYKKYIMASVVLLSIGTNLGVYCYEAYNSGILAKISDVNEVINNRSLETLANETRNSFVRIENMNPEYVNASEIYGYPTINGYYSIENKYLSRFNLIYKNSDSSPITNIKGVGTRSILDDILSVKYIVSNNDRILPYGFEKTPISDVFVNKFYIPFGFTYSSYMLPYEAASLSTLDLQEAVLKSCLVDTNIDGVKHVDSVYLSEIKLRKKNISYTEDEKNRDRYFFKKYKCKLPYDGELYLKIPNADLMEDDSMIFYINGRCKKVYTTTSKSKWYSGEKDLLVCLGHVKKGDVEVSIELNKKDMANFDNISFECISTNTVESETKDLAREHMYDININKNGFKGYISNKGNKLLFISIPYNEGWSAYVDSEKTRIYRANEGFMAVKLSEGDHFVEFKYKRPYQGLGIGLSISGLVLLVILILRRRRNIDRFNI